MRRSLRLQLLGWLLIPLVGVVVTNTWFTYRDAQQTATIITDRTLLASARTMAERLQAADGKIEAVIPPAALEMFETEFRDRVYYRVTHADAENREQGLLAGHADLP